MDKDKLLEWIDENVEIVYLEHCALMIHTNNLIEAIENGEFYKEPCEECSKWEQRNIEVTEYHKHYMDKPWFKVVNYCQDCGRKLKKI